MIKRLIKKFTCSHIWKGAYSDWLSKTYVCHKCGNAQNVYVMDEDVWRIRRYLKGDKFE